MSIVKVNDINMYFEIHGEGEPLVMIQGMGIEISSVLKNMEPFISEFAERYRVIAFDNRGVGRTDKPDEPYSIEMMAEDTIGLMDELGIKCAHFIGGSMGSCILQVIAAKYPERVNGLVLYLATTNFSDTLKTETESSLDIQEVENGEIKRIHPLFMQDYPPTPESLLRQLEANMKFNGKKLLNQIKAPTLIVNATKDQFIPMEYTEEFAASIHHSKMILIDGDHLFQMTQNESLIRPALEFLAEIDIKSTITQNPPF